MKKDSFIKVRKLLQDHMQKNKVKLGTVKHVVAR